MGSKDSYEKPVSSKERQKDSEKMFDSLLTINVDCQSKSSSKKSPNLKSPTKSLSPGTSKSPLISPSGKPTYLLAHMHNKSSMQAEKMHRAQEHKEHKELSKKGSEKASKSRKEHTEPRRRSHEERKSIEERRSQDEVKPTKEIKEAK